jgi:tyrosine-protein kinase Etk/Wzc
VETKSIAATVPVVPEQPISIEIPMTLDERERPAREPAELSAIDVLLVLARWRRQIVLGTVAAAALSAIIAFLLPSRFTATTILLPPQQSSNSAAALALAQANNLGPLASLAGSSLGLKNPNDLQVAILRSRTIGDAMVDRFHLMALYHNGRRSDARKKLESATDIENGLKDGLIHISVTDRDPRRAAEMANAYVEEYRKLSASIAVSEASQRRLFFEGQLADEKDKLASTEEAFKQTEQNTGLIQLDRQTRAVIESVARLRGEVAAKEVQIRAMRQFAAEENPDLRLAEEELAGLRNQLARMSATATSSPGDFLMPKGSMPQAGLEYVRKLREVKYHETIFELLARQFEIAKVDEARQGSVVQVVDKAIVPDKRSSPMRLLIVAVCTATGFLLALLWVLFSEALRVARRDPQQREQLDALARSFSV